MLRCGFLLFVLCLAASAASRAQDVVPLEVVTVAEVLTEVAGPDGETGYRFQPAGAVQQGEELFYTVRIRNSGARPVRRVVVTKPIPSNTIYVSGTAAAPGADVSFSIDGGRTFAAPEALTVPDQEGRPLPAEPALYTHIRWSMRHPLAAGAVALARFRAVFQ